MVLEIVADGRAFFFRCNVDVVDISPFIAKMIILGFNFTESLF